jgi:deoxynucleoside triphosphate triphosphohydrolase SAMHD1
LTYVTNHWDRRLGAWPDPTPGSTRCKRARDLVKSVVLRQPFVRSLAFGPMLVADDDAWRNLATLVDDKGRTDLRRDVCRLAKDYLIVVGQPGLADELDESLLLIDLPDVQGIVATAPVFVVDDQLGPQKYGEGREARRWTEAYEFQNTLGYVYCPKQFAVVVHLAFRELAFQQAGATFGAESWSLTKQSFAELRDLADLLSKRGEILQPLEEPKTVPIGLFLNLVPSKRELIRKYSAEIASLEYKFRSFKSAHGRVATRVEISEWLLQFDYNDIPIALETLRAVNFWDRAALADGLRHGVGTLYGSAPSQLLQVFGIGGATTSAKHLSYLWDDIKQELGFQIRVLNSIEDLVPNFPLLLYDDNVGSGGQSSTVLMQWLGADREQWLVSEEHVAQLGGDTIDRIRACDLSICFITGKRDGLAQVISTAKDLLGREPRGLVVIPTDISCFDAASRVYGTKEAAKRAAEIFSEAGKKALQDRIPVKSTDWIDRNCLGYGNTGGLTIFNYNTPTATLTALWKDCALTNNRWNALFPRRARTS